MGVTMDWPTRYASQEGTPTMGLEEGVAVGVPDRVMVADAVPAAVPLGVLLGCAPTDRVALGVAVTLGVMLEVGLLVGVGRLLGVWEEDCRKKRPRSQAPYLLFNKRQVAGGESR